MKSTKEPIQFTNIETAIFNRDIERCKNLYTNYLFSNELDKNDFPLVLFLFNSLESKRIQITQDAIDAIRYINKNL
ncbi:MAG: hypothetical protein IPL26_21340 [Leptospiraceae bacterium]|nr:hypothetical protein [Leptospiraceae bacterium]